MVSNNFTGLNVNSIFTSSIYGLQNAYQLSLKDGQTGITQSDLLSNSNKYAYLQNSSFSSYMVTNFKQLDKNSDGKITSDEMSGVVNTISQQGLTYQQLMSGVGTNGINSQDLNTILGNFRKIDKNGDGKVSMAEINYFSANKKINDKITQLHKSRSSDISIMYGDKDDDDDSSLVSSSPVSSI